MGYVKFNNRDWGYSGDKGTFARVNNDGTVTVKKAGKGIISSAYTLEIRDYCDKIGIDFDDIRCGQSVTIKVDK